MEIPEHIMSGLGQERVTRIRMAFDFAVTMLMANPSEKLAQDRLAKLIVIGSRDPGRSVGR